MHRPKNIVIAGGRATVTFDRPCRNREVSVKHADSAGLERWRSGAKIQDAFPEMKPPDRELFASGTCPSCYKAMLGRK